MEENSMNNEYTASEVIEIGKAQEMILGEKEPSEVVDLQSFRIPTDSDLDD
jgi:hypothetical protein